MTSHTDETHNAELTSWVASANTPETDFPIQNLPFGTFSEYHGNASARVGVAVGNKVADISALHKLGLFEGMAATAAARCSEPGLNGLMELGPEPRKALRARLSEILRHDSKEHEKNLKEL